jgi:uncharacterized protein YcnI
MKAAHQAIGWAFGALLCVVCAVASAHVTIWPRESRTGAYEKYVVRVPTEGQVATASVELMIPEGATLVSMGAPTGFTYELRKTGERVTSILWTMRINPGEFAEFPFMARNPGKPGAIAWRAIQRFVDGSKAEWSGPAGDKHPASVTTLRADGHEHAHH